MKNQIEKMHEKKRLKKHEKTHLLIKKESVLNTKLNEETKIIEMNDFSPSKATLRNSTSHSSSEVLGMMEMEPKPLILEEFIQLLKLVYPVVR